MSAFTTSAPARQHDPLTIGALDALTMADVALAGASGLDIGGAHHLDAVTPAWLTETLGADVPGAEVVSTRIDDRHDGMTNRMRLEITWNDAGVAAGLPAMVFMKSTPDHPFHLQMVSVLHMAELEAKFYQVVQPELPALAPRAHHAESYAGGRFLIVTEDLPTLGHQPFWLKDTCEISHALAVAHTLGTLHATYWESPRFDTDLAWVRPRTERFGWSWLKATLFQTGTMFLGSEAGQALSAEARELVDTYREHQDAVYDYWETLPRTLLHGDSHFGNTYTTPTGAAGYFDWQVVFSGYGIRDLVYFVISALSAEQEREHRDAIIDTYLAALAAGGVIVDRAEAVGHYALFALDGIDASMATLAQGTYNHDLTATLRNLDCGLSILLEHGVAERIRAIAAG
ncbi:hypothetical protein BH11ACT8_BH11ACT8_08780 [soil metagenome]